MDLLEKILGGIEGGKVLDVATQEGHFVQFLMDNLRSYTEIVGIDISEKAIETARRTVKHGGARFLVMNAERLDFEKESFDTVSISASLHHVANIPRVLDEMKRVLKPVGHFILAEMHRDGQTQAELTFVYLHHWVAEVDSALGILHNKTLPRQDFVNYVTDLGLSSVEYYDYKDHDSDPMEKSRIEQLEGLIERTLQRAERTSRFAELKERGDALLLRLHTVGAQSEPRIMIVGKK